MDFSRYFRYEFHIHKDLVESFYGEEVIYVRPSQVAEVDNETCAVSYNGSIWLAKEHEEYSQIEARII